MSKSMADIVEAMRNHRLVPEAVGSFIGHVQHVIEAARDLAQVPVGQWAVKPKGEIVEVEDRPVDAVSANELTEFYYVRQMRDETKALAKAMEALYDEYQQWLAARMDAAEIKSQDCIGVGYKFTRTIQEYVSMDKQAAEAMGIEPADAVGIVVEFLRDISTDEINYESELVDREPRLVFMRMRGKEFLGRWREEGIVLPPVLRATPKDIIQMRKL